MARSWLARVEHQRALVLLFLAVIAPLLVIGRVAEDVWENEGFSFDRPILLWLHQHATPRLNMAMLWFSHAGSPRVLAAVLIFLWLRRQRGDAFFFAIAVGGAMVLNLLAKIIFGRARPDLWVSLAPEADYSFPSGHTMGATAVMVALVVLAWHTRWRWPLLVVGPIYAVMVGVSRLYLGVHYPSDVLVGWLASLAWVIGVALIRQSTMVRSRWPWRRPAWASSGR